MRVLHLHHQHCFYYDYDDDCHYCYYAGPGYCSESENSGEACSQKKRSEQFALGLQERRGRRAVATLAVTGRPPPSVHNSMSMSSQPCVYVNPPFGLIGRLLPE